MSSGVFRGTGSLRVVLRTVAMIGADTMGHARQLRARHMDGGEEQRDNLEDA
jgi:hypothetical protein